MKSLQQYVNQMDHLLHELIQTATKLRDASLQVISEEELNPLQRRQEDLLSQLETVDQQMKEHYRHQIDHAVQERFHAQLQVFQQLNQEFVQNLNASHGIIQFELRRLEDEDEDYSNLSHLNKMPSAPKRSQAVKPKEDEEEG